MGTDATYVTPAAKPVGLPDTVSEGEKLARIPYTPLKTKFFGLQDEESMAIPAELAEAFETWCTVQDSNKSPTDFFSNIVQTITKPEGDNQSSTTDTAKKKEADLKPTILTYAIQLPADQKIWCMPSSEGSFGPFGSRPKKAAFTLINNWKSSLTMYTPLSLSQTPHFAELHNAWIRTMQKGLSQVVRMTIEARGEGANMEQWTPEKRQEFSERLYACEHAFDIKYLGETEQYEIIADPKAVCCGALKMVDTTLECRSESVSSTEGESAGWSWGKPRAEKHGAWAPIEDLMDTYLRKVKIDGKDFQPPWAWWAMNQTFFNPIVSRGFLAKFAIQALAYGVSGFVTIAGIVTLVGRRLIIGLTFAHVVKAMLNPKKLFGLVPLGKSVLAWFRNRSKGTQPNGGPDDPAAGGATGGGAAGVGAGQAAGAGAGTGAAQMSVATSRQMAPLGRYEADIAQAETPIPLWKRLVVGAQAAAGLSAGPNAAVFGGVQVGARAYLGTSVAVPLVP